MSRENQITPQEIISIALVHPPPPNPEASRKGINAHKNIAQKLAYQIFGALPSLEIIDPSLAPLKGNSLQIEKTSSILISQDENFYLRTRVDALIEKENYHPVCLEIKPGPKLRKRYLIQLALSCLALSDENEQCPNGALYLYHSEELYFLTENNTKLNSHLKKLALQGLVIRNAQNQINRIEETKKSKQRSFFELEIDSETLPQLANRAIRARRDFDKTLEGLGRELVKKVSKV